MQRTIRLLKLKSFVQDSLKRRDFLLSFLLILMMTMVMNHYMLRHTNIYNKAYVHSRLMEDVLIE
jgi:hypothetical protein